MIAEKEIVLDLDSCDFEFTMNKDYLQLLMSTLIERGLSLSRWKFVKVFISKDESENDDRSSLTIKVFDSTAPAAKRQNTV